MPVRPKRPCRHSGCPELVIGGGYCDKHKRQLQKERDARRGSSSVRGYGSHWRKVRQRILQAEPLCRRCAVQGILEPAEHVHHIDGDPRNNRADNLEPLCARCHNEHTAKEQAFGRKGQGGANL